MSFTRPTLGDLVTRIEADFVSRMTLTGAVLRRSVVNVISRVLAGAAHMLHGHLDYLSRQLFPDESDDAYLVRQASLFGLVKTAATYATGTATVTAAAGGTVPAGTVLVRSDGTTYTVDADVVVVGAPGTGTAALTCVTAGSIGTLTAGDVLSFESPIAGVDATATVLASVADGTDEETTAALRTRLLARMAEAPLGGTVADYVAWAKAVAGVTRVWVSPLELGPGTVVVRFARDNDVTPIPDAGEVAVVQAALDAVKPAHATVTVVAPIAVPINYTIAVVPNTAAVKAAVTAELTDLLLRTGTPGGTVLLSAERTAIGNAAGLTDYTLTAPAADTVFATSQLPTMGTITWV